LTVVVLFEHDDAERGSLRPAGTDAVAGITLV